MGAGGVGKVRDRMTRARTVQAIIWLHTNNVPAFTDEIAEDLLTIERKLRVKLKKHPAIEDGVQHILEVYMKALKAVATIGYLHAGAEARGLPESLRRSKEGLERRIDGVEVRRRPELEEVEEEVEVEEGDSGESTDEDEDVA